MTWSKQHLSDVTRNDSCAKTRVHVTMRAARFLAGFIFREMCGNWGVTPVRYFGQHRESSLDVALFGRAHALRAQRNGGSVASP